MDAAHMSPEQLATAADHLMATKMFSLASCVMLFYDIAITFGDEVEKIWKQRFTGATVLWFLNRYLSPLGYIVIIVSFHDPSWSKAACQRYVLYPEVLKIFTATAVGIIFILRLYSIYSKRSIILYGFGGLLVAMLAVKIWAFTDGVMLELPPGFVGCILTGRSAPDRSHSGDRIIFTWVAELVFDSAVFFATLYRTITLYRRTLIGEALSLITVIMRDGIMYFAAIFVSNLVTVLIFIFATQPDLKVINASFSTLITSLMVSRLMLNLRAEVLRRGPVMRGSSGGYHGRDSVVESYQLASATNDGTGKTFESSLIGNLGAPIITFERAGYDDEYDDDEFYDELDSRNASRLHGDSERGHPLPLPLPELGGRERTSSEASAGLDKKPSLTGLLSHTHPPAKLRSKRRPRTADSNTSAERDTDHTRSLPAPLVVQVTEEVVVVGEAPDPLRARLHPGARPSTSPPLTPLSPMPPISPAPSSRAPPSPSAFPRTPPSPPTPRSPQPESPRTPRAYPSRPPHSAGAAYPPPSPHAPGPLPPGNGYGPRPPRSAGAVLRPSWMPPPSWRLSVDRDARRPPGGS
ncbi:hypothetical protein BD413DRAFT_490546 [Trametes elegans]|nr:hypothetical protein BD413DRAFT_490546 [Trametes elegans]